MSKAPSGFATGAAAAATALLLSACGSSPEARRGTTGQGRQDLLLVSYAVTKGAYERILPAFEAEWKAKTGQDVSIKTSYGGSGTQTRAVIDGL